jgi:hypothetical protein
VQSSELTDIIHHNSFLVEEKYVTIPTQEIKLSSLCIDYLNLPGFYAQNIDELIFTGYYAFMDYAIAFWIRHLEAGIIGFEKDEDEIAENEIMRIFSESLECFLDRHWASPKSSLPVSKRNSDRLQRFRDAPFYDTLEQAVVSTRKQLTFYGKMKKEEVALDLGDVLLKVRSALEAASSRPMNNTARNCFQQMYGTNLYKCSRFSCNYFSNGFSTREQRDQHMEKHDRPFQCTVEGCPTVIFGLTTAKELERHMKDTHGTVADQEQEFPAENDLAPPKELERPVRGLPPAPRIRERKVYGCTYCSKVFSRNYNLKSHLTTHNNVRPYDCSFCEKRFARLNDCNRHEDSHTEQRFTCKGCSKVFTRADSLKNHHKSKTGQQCILPTLPERDSEQGNAEPGPSRSQNEYGLANEVMIWSGMNA